MAICPFATHNLIAPGSNDPRITPRIAILHSDGGNAYNLHDWFDGPSGGIESHFHVPKDGKLFQYRNTEFEADANYLANPFSISIETQGTGHEPWTEAQLKTIIRLLIWLNDVHPQIKLQKVNAWDGSGIGYHIQFGSPGKWTPSDKICPGPIRIEQYNNIILPALTGEGMEEVVSWKDRVPKWTASKGHRTKDGKLITQQARWALAQARTHAILGQRAAESAYKQAEKNSRAIEALAEKLDATQPGIKQAVIDALGEKITLDISVSTEDEDDTEESI